MKVFPKLLTAVVMVGLFAAPVVFSGGSTTAHAATAQPNIVLILTDDQRSDQMSNMPITQNQVTSKGTKFTNGYISNPLCCPSRASILTGRYSHGTKIYNNKPPSGGFDTFRSRGEESSTVATWLNGGGYRTALIGKYLNGYGDASYVPPGWDQWFSLLTPATGDGEGSGGFYDYTLSVNGTSKSFGTTEADYSVDVLADYAKNFITSTPADKPLFLYFAPRTPHAPATAPQRYRRACSGLAPNRPPNFNESNVSDKPPYVRSFPSLTSTQIAKLDAFYLKQCRSLVAVDDAVGTIANTLANENRINNTLFVYMSDNGLANGEHRWDKKSYPYEEAVQVPYIVRYDQIAGAPASDGHLVTNIDLAPTFADAANVATPSFVEGKSLLPLLRNNDTGWRTDYLMEHAGNIGIVPAYCGVHTNRWVYVKYGKNQFQADGYEELYDLSSDPYQLTNLLETDPNDATVQSQRNALHTRMLELCKPAPPGYTPS